MHDFLSLCIGLNFNANNGSSRASVGIAMCLFILPKTEKKNYVNADQKLV